MSKRITLTDSDLRVLELVLTWQINKENTLNSGNFILGVERLKELLAKLAQETNEKPRGNVG